MPIRLMNPLVLAYSGIVNILQTGVVTSDVPSFCEAVATTAARPLMKDQNSAGPLDALSINSRGNTIEDRIEEARRRIEARRKRKETLRVFHERIEEINNMPTLMLDAVEKPGGPSLDREKDYMNAFYGETGVGRNSRKVPGRFSTPSERELTSTDRLHGTNSTRSLAAIYRENGAKRERHFTEDPKYKPEIHDKTTKPPLLTASEATIASTCSGSSATGMGGTGLGTGLSRMISGSDVQHQDSRAQLDRMADVAIPTGAIPSGDSLIEKLSLVSEEKAALPKFVQNYANNQRVQQNLAERKGEVGRKMEGFGRKGEVGRKMEDYFMSDGYVPEAAVVQPEAPSRKKAKQAKGHREGARGGGHRRSNDGISPSTTNIFGNFGFGIRKIAEILGPDLFI